MMLMSQVHKLEGPSHINTGDADIISSQVESSIVTPTVNVGTSGSHTEASNLPDTNDDDDEIVSEDSDAIFSPIRQQKKRSDKSTRRRMRNEGNWFTNKNKIKRNSGVSYQYKVKSNTDIVREVGARKVGPPCQCKNKCFEKIGPECIKKTFEEYWALGSYDLQNADLQKKK